MIPPKAPIWRMRAETAGVDRMPPLPITIRPKPLAAAIFATIWIASRLKKRPSPPTTSVLPSKPSSESKIDWMKFSRYPGCWKTGTFLRRPEVPGFWSGKGFVATVLIMDGVSPLARGALRGPVVDRGHEARSLGARGGRGNDEGAFRM